MKHHGPFLSDNGKEGILHVMLLAGKFVRLDFIHRHMRCHSVGKLEMLFILAFHENRKELLLLFPVYYHRHRPAPDDAVVVLRVIAGFLRPSHDTAVVDFKTDDRI